MYQVFSFLLDHLHFSEHFFFTFMEQLFMNHPICVPPILSFLHETHCTSWPMAIIHDGFRVQAKRSHGTGLFRRSRRRLINRLQNPQLPILTQCISNKLIPDEFNWNRDILFCFSIKSKWYREGPREREKARERKRDGGRCIYFHECLMRVREGG